MAVADAHLALKLPRLAPYNTDACPTHPAHTFQGHSRYSLHTGIGSPARLHNFVSRKPTNAIFAMSGQTFRKKNSVIYDPSYTISRVEPATNLPSQNLIRVKTLSESNSVPIQMDPSRLSVHDHKLLDEMRKFCTQNENSRIEATVLSVSREEDGLIVDLGFSQGGYGFLPVDELSEDPDRVCGAHIVVQTGPDPSTMYFDWCVESVLDELVGVELPVKISLVDTTHGRIILTNRGMSMETSTWDSPDDYEI